MVAMARTMRKKGGFQAPDDQPVPIVKRDASGGMNTRQDPQSIADNQFALLQNILLENAGSREIRPGYTRIDNTYPSVASSGYGLFGFNPDGGVFELLAVQKGNIFGWPSSGTFISRKTGFTDGIPTTIIKAGMQTQLDIAIISNGTDDPYAMYQDHTFHDLLSNQYYSMPKTKAICYYGDRVWALKNNLMSFSDAFPATYYPTSSVLIGDQTTYSFTTGDAIQVTIDTVLYDNISLSGCSTIAQVASAINTAVGSTVATVGAFPNPVGVLVITSPTVGTSSITIIDDSSSMKTHNPVITCIAKLFATATRSTNGFAPFDNIVNVFRVPVGVAQALVPTRDQGIIALGADQIWQLSPSAVPSPTTDQPSKILDIGCVAGATAVQVADDIIFLAPDGVRGLFRTQLDKLQTGQSFPLSYVLADQFNSLNWAAIGNACAIFFDNKYLISVPVNGSSYNNEIWVYYPALSTAFYTSTNNSDLSTKKSWVVYSGWNIARFAVMNIGGKQTLFGIDSVTGQVYQLLTGTTDNGTAIVYNEISRAEDFKAPLQFKKGGEFKVRALGGNGTLVVSANADNLGWVQLGTINLSLFGVTFPTIFPVHFVNASETSAFFHLDDAGIIRFKRCEFEIFCSNMNSDITILESIITAFVEDYISEDTYPPYAGPIGNPLQSEQDGDILTEDGQKILT